MSNALLERPVVDNRSVETAPLPKRVARTTTKVSSRTANPPRFSDFDAPVVLPTREQEAQVKVRRKRRTALGNVIASAALFGIATFMAYSASTLAAQVAVEKSRQDGIVARGRTAQAERQTEVLQERVSGLSARGRVASWAPNAGFVSSEMLVDPNAVPEVGRAPKTLVAQRD